MEEIGLRPAGEPAARAEARAGPAPAPAPALEALRPLASAGAPQGRSAEERRPLAARAWMVIALATLVYAGHALLFSGWVIDDAGISFVYARNLAAGHGLVSQPGMAPVEGYSNFLWVLLLAPAFRLGLFHPLLTPKLLSLGLVIGSFVLLDGGLRRSGGSPRLSLTLLLLLSVNTAFVIWTTSGLENPLYVFLLCALFRLIAAEHEAGAGRSYPRWYPLSAGLLVTALALTRPDAILCGALYPLLTLLPVRVAGSRAPAWRAARRRLLLYGSAFAASFGAFLAFRLAYFGQLLPNTYYAKGGLAPHGLLNALTLQVAGVIKLLRLLGAVAGTASGLFGLALIAGTVYALARGLLRYLHLITLAFAVVPAIAYMLLPFDWMPGFRFATAALPFLYAFTLALAATLAEGLLPASRRRLAANLAIMATVGLSAALFLPPSIIFAARPTVPFSQVVSDFGLAFNRYAEMLEVRDGSILLPDVGGALYASRLRVYDLAGLCDRTIGRTLRHDPAAFHDYVFGELRPTFIHIHEYWTAVAVLELDPRFQRDYVPLVKYVEEWVRVRTGLELHSGDFVRREVAERRPDAVRKIREELILRYQNEIAARAQPAPASPRDLSPGAPAQPQDLH